MLSCENLNNNKKPPAFSVCVFAVFGVLIRSRFIGNVRVRGDKAFCDFRCVYGRVRGARRGTWTARSAVAVRPGRAIFFACAPVKVGGVDHVISRVTVACDNGAFPATETSRDAIGRYVCA